jgi:hypothetical protein
LTESHSTFMLETIIVVPNAASQILGGQTGLFHTPYVIGTTPNAGDSLTELRSRDDHVTR